LVAAEEIGLIVIGLDAMWGIAVCQADAGDAVTAARLLGWVHERLSRLGAPSDADDLAFEEGLRDRLGSERLASELAAGAALAREEAINLALGRSDLTTPG